MTMNALDCMVKAIEMDAKAAVCTDAPATALYQELAQQWRTLYDQAIWQDWAGTPLMLSSFLCVGSLPGQLHKIPVCLRGGHSGE
jgi:hypothetical protein